MPVFSSVNGVFPVLPRSLWAARLLRGDKYEEGLMNWDQVEGKWKQIKGEAKTRWGKLTDDDLDVAGGQRDKLVGRVQERYGIAKDQAQAEVEDWNKSLRDDNDALRERGAQSETDRDLNRKAS
jgi:uncharacterized protein YjbJ (UPF0337 family)